MRERRGGKEKNRMREGGREGGREGREAETGSHLPVRIDTLINRDVNGLRAITHSQSSTHGARSVDILSLLSERVVLLDTNGAAYAAMIGRSCGIGTPFEPITRIMVGSNRM